MSSHFSLLFGAIPAEVKTWQAFPRSPSLVKATEFLTFPDETYQWSGLQLAAKEDGTHLLTIDHRGIYLFIIIIIYYYIEFKIQENTRMGINARTGLLLLLLKDMNILKQH